MPHTLVPSDRVEHVNVYGRDGAKLGTIERLMLDKVSGTVAYAVIKTGGLLASHHHYPVRWDALRFDPARQAFLIELTLEDLRAGPSEFDEDDFDWGDRSRSSASALLDGVGATEGRGDCEAGEAGGRGLRKNERDEIRCAIPPYELIAQRAAPEAASPSTRSGLIGMMRIAFGSFPGTRPLVVGAGGPPASAFRLSSGERGRTRNVRTGGRGGTDGSSVACCSEH